MNDLEGWLFYAGITAALALPTYGIKDEAKGLLRAIKNIASVLFVLAGITLAALTFALVLGRVAPNLGSGDNSNYQDECVPDPWGGC